MTESGFKVIPFREFRKLGVSQMTPKPRVVFVNRRKAFKPPVDTLARYHDFMRRYKDRGERLQRQFSLDGSKYDTRYRHKLLKDRESIQELRKLSAESRTRTVYMVYDKPRPDADIIVSICKVMMNEGVW